MRISPWPIYQYQIKRAETDLANSTTTPVSTSVSETRSEATLSSLTPPTFASSSLATSSTDQTIISTPSSSQNSPEMSSSATTSSITLTSIFSFTSSLMSSSTPPSSTPSSISSSTSTFISSTSPTQSSIMSAPSSDTNIVSPSLSSTLTLTSELPTTSSETTSSPPIFTSSSQTTSETPLSSSTPSSTIPLTLSETTPSSSTSSTFSTFTSSETPTSSSVFTSSSTIPPSTSEISSTSLSTFESTLLTQTLSLVFATLSLLVFSQTLSSAPTAELTSSKIATSSSETTASSLTEQQLLSAIHSLLLTSETSLTSASPSSSSSSPESTTSSSSTSSKTTSSKLSSSAPLTTLASLTSSDFTLLTSLITRGDTTITTLVSVPTSSQNGDPAPSSKNAKLIGGLVGSIGGVIVIAGILLLYVFVRRKRKQFTNQSPDFNDSTSTDNFFLGAPPAKEGLPSPNNDRTRLRGSDEKIFNNSDTELGGRDSSSGGFLKNIIAMKGFKRLSGQNQDTINNDDLTLFSGPPGSNGTPVKTVGGARAYSANKDSDSDQVETPTHTNFRHTSQDYTYRGVTNSNNLDSVFKKLGGPTTGNSTNSNSNGAPTIINGPISPTSVYASNAASNRNSQLGADDFYFNEDSRTPFRNPLVDYRGHKAPYPTSNDQYRGFGQSRFQENFE